MCSSPSPSYTPMAMTMCITFFSFFFPVYLRNHHSMSEHSLVLLPHHPNTHVDAPAHTTTHPRARMSLCRGATFAPPSGPRAPDCRPGYMESSTADFAPRLTQRPPATPGSRTLPATFAVTLQCVKDRLK